MAAPETNPFSREKVITLVITEARDGSRNPLRPSSSPSVPPTANPSIGFVRLIAFPRVRAVWSNTTSVGAKSLAANSLRIGIGLHHAENIAFRVFAIREVAHGRNRRFRQDVFSAGFQDGSYRGIHRVHANRVGGRRDASWLAHHAAVDAHLAFLARGHHPIFHRAGPLIEFPAKDLSVECGGAVRLRCGYFKMNDARHSSPSLDLRANFSTCDPAVFNALRLRLQGRRQTFVLRTPR